MAALTGLALAGIGSAVGGAVIGSIASSGDRARAQQAMQEAYQQILDVGAPPDLSQAIIKEKLQAAGVYTPQLEDSIQQDATAFAKIQENPQLRDAQMKSLQMLQQRGEGGLTAADRAAFNQTRNKVAQESEGKRQQILQNMAARGMGGSGAELAAQLSSAQAGDQNLSAEGDRLAAIASQNALQSTAQAGQLGGQIRGQDFDVAAKKAQAADELNRFNTQNQIALQQRNVASQNQAQASNLSNAQRISDYNTQMANAELERQAQARQSLWQNQLAAAQAKSNALIGQGQNAAANAARTAGTWAGIGSGVAGGLNQANAYDQQSGLIKALAAKGNTSTATPIPSFDAMTSAQPTEDDYWKKLSQNYGQS